MWGESGEGAWPPALLRFSGGRQAAEPPKHATAAAGAMCVRCPKAAADAPKNNVIFQPTRPYHIRR